MVTPPSGTMLKFRGSLANRKYHASPTIVRRV